MGPNVYYQSKNCGGHVILTLPVATHTQVETHALDTHMAELGGIYPFTLIHGDPPISLHLLFGETLNYIGEAVCDCGPLGKDVAM